MDFDDFFKEGVHVSDEGEPKPFVDPNNAMRFDSSELTEFMQWQDQSQSQRFSATLDQFNGGESSSQPPIKQETQQFSTIEDQMNEDESSNQSQHQPEAQPPMLAYFDEDEPPDDNPEPQIDGVPEPIFEFNSVMFKPSKSLHREMMTHVLWPRHLLRLERDNLDKHETGLLELMIDVVDSFENSDILHERVSKLMKSLHRIKTSTSPEVISSEINRLEAGDMTAMYIKAQNTCLLLYMRPAAEDDEQKRLIASTFAVQLDAATIDGSKRSDMKMNFPTQSLDVEFSDLIKSPEFASQLVYLNENAIKKREQKQNGNKQPNNKNNIKKPNTTAYETTYVSQWLVPTLCDRSSTVVQEAEFSVITKKIRDDVYGSQLDTAKPFRRSGYWTVLKVLLQISLTVDHNKNDGKLLYKLVMLKYLTAMLNFYCAPLYPTLKVSLVRQLQAKIARRIEKINETFGEQLDQHPDYQNVINDACIVLKKTRKLVNGQIQDLQTSIEVKSTLGTLKELNFEVHARQSVRKLQDYLTKRLEEPETDQTEQRLVIKDFVRHPFDKPGMPSLKYFTKLKGNIAIGMFLYDFENYILYKCDENDHRLPELREMSAQYGARAAKHYVGDQLGYSRMLLTHLKIVQMMDEIVTEEYRTYKSHHSSINKNIFDSLMLPHRPDMVIANKLQAYFRRRNYGHIKLNGILEDEKPMRESFACRYAGINKEMCVILEQIKQEENKQIKIARTNFNKAKAQYERLKMEADAMEHEFRVNEFNKREHAPQCAKCDLEEKMKKVRVKKYECMLPEKDYEKLAVVFELNCPDEISALRDVLYDVVKLVQSKQLKTTTIVGKWNEHDKLAKYCRSTSKRVFLGSQKKLTLTGRNDDITDNTFDEFKIPCGYNLFYFGEENTHLPIELERQSISEKCQFTVEKGSAYDGLQWMLESDHSQNSVLARQSECPQNLQISEFKNFGTLRSDGFSFRLRKLTSFILNEGLSFETKSVQALIMQTIWELGPACDGNDPTWYRKTHQDFANPEFVTAMCKSLEDFIDKQKANWKHPNKLIMVSLIAVRMLEMNDSDCAADQIVALLQKLRDIADDWINKVQAAMAETQNQADVAKLRRNLVEIAIGGALTFFVHFQHQHFKRIFESYPHALNTASQMWLHFMTTINLNVLLDESQETKSSMRMLLRLVRRIGINIQTEIRQTFIEYSIPLYEFINKQWRKSTEGILTLEEERSEQKLVVKVQTENVNYVQIDIVTGEFLVNNLPVARLSTEITKNDSFKRVFGQFIFEVQQETSKTFSTVHKNNDCDYSFGIDRNEIIITETRSNGDKLELIPVELLAEEIPYLLVEKYSHWWNKVENTIEFRPKCFNDKQFAFGNGVQYQLDLNNDSLVQVKTKRKMLDVTSDSYKKIVNQLARLESEQYIHIFVEAPNVAKVECVRMHIKFIVCPSQENEDEFDVLSNEYTNMRVSLKQNCGTLYGLNNGLLLESTANIDDPKILIVPHGGVVSIPKSPLNHQIDIDSNLRSPPFHTYNVDEFCQQLKATNSSFSAWFYLAYEHAAQDSFLFIVRKLINDSNRLKGLHVQTQIKNPKKDEESLNDLKLNKCDYFRCLPMHPNLRVSDTFIDHQSYFESPTPFYVHTEETSTSTLARKVSTHYHEKAYKAPENCNLSNFLIGNQNKFLTGIHIVDDDDEILDKYINANLANMFIALYDIARTEKYSREKFTLILSLLAHDGSLEPYIMALQTVAQNPAAFRDIHPPNVTRYDMSCKEFDFEVIENLVYKVNKYPEHFQRYSEERQNRYETQMAAYSHAIGRFVTAKWPCESLDETFYCVKRPENIHVGNLENAINAKLRNWNNIQLLNAFTVEVQDQLAKFVTAKVEIPLREWFFEQTNNEAVEQLVRPFQIDFEQKMCENLELEEYSSDIEKAERIYNRNAEDLLELQYTAEEWWEILKKVAISSKAQHLVDAGIYPRFVVTLMLPKLLAPFNDKLKSVIGAFAVTMSRERRSNRIEAYRKLPQMKAALDRELESEPHTNWSPCEYPEWLLFELEQNLTIRLMQIVMAKRMIQPPEVDTKHSVMQLNMGEGKTAVIVPIIALRLANQEHACQVTVLKSLYATNFKSLRQCLGGMLNRRIYTFPCRRDLPTNNYVKQFHEIYEECKQQKGVILTLPEYRLSFQLKIYESMCKNESKYAEHYLKAHQWLNENVRNVLDESDAILQPKFQLIYTVGDQLPLDGGAHRWTIIQAVLKRIPLHMKDLYLEHGDEKVEFDTTYKRNEEISGVSQQDAAIKRRSDVFTPCRIFDDAVYNELKSKLIDDFFNGHLNITFTETNENSKKILRVIMNEEQNSKEECENMMGEFSSEEQNTLLILRGLLRFDVLKLVMSKRWRVNYGVNQKNSRKMGVPFKAKDVAADMTEFGHPDVAICLTHLSYYYSGLTDEQLYEVFAVLENQQDARSIYESWIRKMPSHLVDRTIRQYAGINLSEPKQRNELIFPLFRYNMYVIDFWLSHVVFPREAKTFEKKLMCTAWDLCSERLTHTVSGFSGTNDTKNILPMTVTQNDLEQLIETNNEVREILLSEENQSYKALFPNISGKDILIQLKKAGIPVLLDCGAVMLELNNKEVACEWLQLVSEEYYEAAVFFDTNNVLMVIDRNDIITEFDNSIYRDKLDKCVVYLDDVHTRGTDLKFPIGWRAAVTLSGDITRDKTVQACMRMRLLGKGHTISFWASNEADVRIRQTCNVVEDQPTNENVIEFICKNSNTFEKENMAHWTAAAYNYAKKTASHHINENRMVIDDESTAVPLQLLYQQCVDKEYVTLKQMYGFKQDTLLTEITHARFDKLKETLREQAPNNNQVIDFVTQISNKLEMKLTQLAQGLVRFTQALDEEQEKELENELEEERNVLRPPAGNAATCKFDEGLKELIKKGASDKCFEELTTNNVIKPLREAFFGKKIFKPFLKSGKVWSDNMFATRDFVRVLENERTAGDEFLRPVSFVARISRRNGSDVILLLSPFECENLVKEFKSSDKSALHMYNPRLSQYHSDLLNERHLQLSVASSKITIEDEAQINMFSGSMYFSSQAEQNAYCNFMGLIPRPRTIVQQLAFEDNRIQANGFVRPIHRNGDIQAAVSACNFTTNPTGLAIKIIEARHQFMHKESHVASILEKAVKMRMDDSNSTE